MIVSKNVFKILLSETLKINCEQRLEIWSENPAQKI